MQQENGCKYIIPFKGKAEVCMGGESFPRNYYPLSPTSSGSFDIYIFENMKNIFYRKLNILFQLRVFCFFFQLYIIGNFQSNFKKIDNQLPLSQQCVAKNKNKNLYTVPYYLEL